jgi:hypothetical protein
MISFESVNSAYNLSMIVITVGEYGIEEASCGRRLLSYNV